MVRYLGIISVIPSLQTGTRIPISAYFTAASHACIISLRTAQLSLQLIADITSVDLSHCG